MAFSNPPSEASKPISKREFSIAGIIITVFGLEEIPSFSEEVACIWLLHPRLANHAHMVPAAEAILKDWHKRLEEGKAGKPPKGLIAISFDQRNHGAREVTPIANRGWREGNETHAQDMFSIYRTSFLHPVINLLITNTRRHRPRYLSYDASSPFYSLSGLRTENHSEPCPGCLIRRTCSLVVSIQ